MNHRRKLVIALGGSAFTAPFAARAQQPGTPAGKIWRVGLLTAASQAASAPFVAAFVQGMRELGYVEGGNLLIEARYGDGDLARLPGLAAELVQLKVDLIWAAGNDATLAAQAATSTIPIVMPSTSDPVGNGIIKSLARPGGNITGIADLSAELGAKRLEMLLAMMASPASSPAAARTPKVSRVAVLGRSQTRGQLWALKHIQDAGLSVGITIVPIYAGTSGGN